jgi:hypothetical protein
MGYHPKSETLYAAAERSSTLRTLRGSNSSPFARKMQKTNTKILAETTLTLFHIFLFHTTRRQIPQSIVAKQ